MMLLSDNVTSEVKNIRLCTCLRSRTSVSPLLELFLGMLQHTKYRKCNKFLVTAGLCPFTFSSAFIILKKLKALYGFLGQNN